MLWCQFLQWMEHVRFGGNEKCLLFSKRCHRLTHFFRSADDVRMFEDVCWTFGVCQDEASRIVAFGSD